MRLAMVVGALMFNLVIGFYEVGMTDPIAAPDSGSGVQAFEDCFPPPPNWP